jgi:putative membrane protein
MPVAMHGFYGSRMWGGAGAGFPFWAIGGAILALALLALAVTAIVVLVRTARRAPRTESLDIIKARFARGEITKEQYEEMRRTLSI